MSDLPLSDDFHFPPSAGSGESGYTYEKGGPWDCAVEPIYDPPLNLLDRQAGDHKRLEDNPVVQRYWIEAYLRKAREWIDRAERAIGEYEK